MFQVARNDYRVYLGSKQRGIALLVMLAMILVAFTTIAISRLSQNSAEQKVRAKTTQALIQSRDAIMASAVTSAVAPNTPPGILPCPDMNGDGQSDSLGSGCVRYRGLVPFVTLGIPQPFDGSGAPIWYVVPSLYAGSPTSPHNSSRVPNLQLNSQSVAFLLIAPGIAIGSQNRPSLAPYSNPPEAAFAQYLEGLNAGASPTNYTDLYNPTQNDQVLSISPDYFWTNVEAEVVRQIRNTINAACISSLPPAVSQFGDGDTGPSAVMGGLPFTLTPTCAATPAFPNWLSNNWSRTFYYATCATNCISLRDISGAIVGSASAIVIAPGVRISGVGPSPRAPGTGTIANYFELENADNSNNIFTKVKSDNLTPPTQINDRIYVIR